jgi:hypothetical protein
VGKGGNQKSSIADIPYAAACFEWRLEAAPSDTEIRIGIAIVSAQHLKHF